MGNCSAELIIIFTVTICAHTHTHTRARASIGLGGRAFEQHQLARLILQELNDLGFGVGRALCDEMREDEMREDEREREIDRERENAKIEISTKAICP